MKKNWIKLFVPFAAIGSTVAIIPAVSCAQNQNQKQEFWLEESSATINNQNEFVVNIYTTNLKDRYIGSNRIGFLFDDMSELPTDSIMPYKCELDEINNKIIATFKCNQIKNMNDFGIHGEIKISSAMKQGDGLMPPAYLFTHHFFKFHLLPHDNFAMLNQQLVLSTDKTKLEFRFKQDVGQSIQIKSASVSYNDKLAPINHSFSYQYESDKKTIDFSISTAPQLVIPEHQSNCSFKIVYKWQATNEDDIWFSYKFTSLFW